jgi:hypothetical protein
MFIWRGRGVEEVVGVLRSLAVDLNRIHSWLFSKHKIWRKFGVQLECQGGVFDSASSGVVERVWVKVQRTSRPRPSGPDLSSELRGWEGSTHSWPKGHQVRARDVRRRDDGRQPEGRGGWVKKEERATQ